MELTEKEKIAYECGYRAACLKHNIPFVKVERTQDKIVRASVEITNFAVFACKLKDEFKKFIAEQIVKGLDRELSKTWKDENKTIEKTT